MAGADPAQEHVGTPDPVERGFATLGTLKYVFILLSVQNDKPASRPEADSPSELVSKPSLKR